MDELLKFVYNLLSCVYVCCYKKTLTVILDQYDIDAHVYPSNPQDIVLHLSSETHFTTVV